MNIVHSHTKFLVGDQSGADCILEGANLECRGEPHSSGVNSKLGTIPNPSQGGRIVSMNGVITLHSSPAW